MARLVKNVLGIPNGKIGPLMFKIRNGTPYISMAPVRSTKPKSAKLIETNKKFGFVSSLSKSLSDDFLINALWKDSEIKGETVRHKINSINLPLVDSSRNLDMIRMVPSENLFEAALLNFLIEDDLMSFTFAPFSISLRESYYSDISAHGFIHLNNAVSEMNAEKKFMHIQSPRIPYLKGSVHTFSIPIDNTELENYNFRKIHFVLILENYKGEQADCSEKINVLIS
jgi:hypothetical protein